MSTFHDLPDEYYYPGSKQRRTGRPAAEEKAPDPFEGVKPRVYIVKGREVDFFTVGQLALALNRKAVTMRKWEREGVIPKATFTAPNPTGDPRARRRLYSRAQAEGMVRIAAEEKIVGESARGVSSTLFSERVIALFRELAHNERTGQ